MFFYLLCMTPLRYDNLKFYVAINAIDTVLIYVHRMFFHRVWLASVNGCVQCPQTLILSRRCCNGTHFKNIFVPYSTFSKYWAE